MDLERPHRTTTTTNTQTTTSELFICFTSHLSNSSSSMRHSSKSILTPSLSRRLRHSGSLRGGAQSPALFPSNITKKNRGSSVFSENKEPSSPKVTCIGQVRVKTKKQGKKIKLRACGSKRIKVEETNFSICDTLKGFGSEFSCFLPCSKSCFSGSGSSSSNGRKEKSCFRWLVSLQDGEGGKRRDIELVVGGEEEEEDEIVEEKERGRVIERECSRRRSIFDDMEFDDLFSSSGNNVESNGDNVNGNSDNVGECEEKGRVSVCVPPKNALLLMRCRSDPKRMASLSQKFLDGSFVHEVGDENLVEVDEKLEVEEEICVQVDDKLEVEEIVEVKEEVCVQIDDKLEVEEICGKVDEELEVKEENCVLDDGNFEVREEGMIEIEEEKREEVVKLDEVEDEICENLEVVEVKIEDLVVSSEELEEKIEEFEAKIEDLVVSSEEMEEKVEGVVDEKQEEIVEVSLEEEIEENHGVENIEEEEQVLSNLEETQLVESENFANGCSIEAIGVDEVVEEGEDFANVGGSIETITIEDSVKEGEKFANERLIEAIAIEEEVKVYENAQELVEMLEEQTMEVQEERVIEESCELFTNSCTILEEESKDLDPKQEKIEVEKVLVEEKQGRKSIEKVKTKTKPTLPDCLLLMMCEPKLSMEVSKETWISSTDFIRCLPERHHSKKPKKTETSEGSDDQPSIISKKAKPAAVAALPPVGQLVKTGIQPGRSSISFPASGSSMANMIEQKLAKAGVGVGYEPFVLPRCKSAPMRSTAKFGCKLEPHRSATCGVGTAGIGF